MTAEDVIRKLNLEPLTEEGGYFRRTYKGHCSAIFYLITQDSPSRFHRLASDEVWLFHQGDPCCLIQISPDGQLKEMILGSASDLQAVVHAGHWQSARLLPGGQWALFSCVVSPAFEPHHFELADLHALAQRYPEHRKVILN